MTKKAAEPEAPRAISLKKHALPLSVKLTIDERLDRADKLARVLEDIRNEETRQESLKRQMKSDITALEARRDDLSIVVARCAEIRDVEVEDVAYPHIGKVWRTRQDTGEVIHERAMTQDERQEKLPLPAHA